MGPKRDKRRLEGSPRWGWVVFFLLLWWALLRSQNPGLMSDDSGEMVAAAAGLGLPHPPGYPLLSLLGHLAMSLPVGTPAFRMNLLAGGLLFASIFFLWGAYRDLEAREPGSGISAWVGPAVLVLLFFSSRNVWAQALTAKGCVYHLSLLFACFLLWALTRPKAGKGLWLLVLFLWGLGLAVHWQTMVLWGPLVLYQAWKAGKGSRSLLLMAGLLVIAASLYLYLPLRAIRDCVPSWGYPVTPKLFYWVISRQLVSDVETWVQPWSFYVESFREVARVGMLDHFPGLGLLALWGWGRLLKGHRSLAWSLASLFLPVLLAVLLVHERRNIYLMGVYLVPLGGILAFLGAWGLRSLGRSLPSFREGAAFLVLGSVCLWTFHVARSVDKSRYSLAEDLGVNILKGLPRGTILLAEGDHYVMPLWYQREVLGLRRDILFEPAVFLVHGWGWKQLGDQLPRVRGVVASTVLFQARLDALTAMGPDHPLYYSLGRPKLGPALERMPGQWSPEGLVMRWGPEGKSDPRARPKLDLRLRGALEEMDPSSAQIIRYYGAVPSP